MSNPFFNPLQMALMPLFKQAQAEDAEFASEVNEKSNRAENPKSWQQCCEYVLGEAYKYAKEHKDGNVGVAGCDDATLTSMIKHYYDEDNIEITPIGGAKVSVQKADTKTASSSTTATATKKGAKKTQSKADSKPSTKSIATNPTTTPSEPKKAPTTAEIRKGADCGDLFEGLFS